MKKIRFILLLVFMMLLTSTNIFAAADLTADDYYEKGNDFYMQKDYSAAVSNYQMAIKLAPEYVQAYLDMGDAYYNQQKYEEAMNAYDAVIKLEPDNSYAYYSKGAALHYLCKYEEAIKAYDEAIKFDQDYSDAYVNKGDSLNRLGRYSEAMKCFDKAAEFNPDDTDINISIGNTYYLQGMYEQAITYYDIVVQAGSYNKNIYINRGTTLYHLSRYYEAIKNLDLGLRIVPDDAEANYFMSISLVKTGDMEGYYPYLKKAVALDKTYMAKARTEEAFKSLSKDDAFIEIVYSAEEDIYSQFENSDILKNNAVASIHFIDLKTSGNTAEDAKVLKAEKEFFNNFYAGNIYNSATADKYHVHRESPYRSEIIKAGRALKGQALVGLKTTCNFSKEKILYTGKQDGTLKAAIIEVAGDFKIDGQSTDVIDYIVFIYNNSAWEYYGYLKTK